MQPIPFKWRYPVVSVANSVWHTASRTREIVRARPGLPFDIATAGVGATMSAVLDVPLGNWLGAGLAVYGVARTAYGIYRIQSGYRFKEGGSSGLRFAEPYSGWQRTSRLGREAIFSSDLNHSLASEADAFPFVLDASPWTPVDLAPAAVRRDLLIRPSKNDAKIRLSTDFGADSGPTVLQLTDYMSFRVTNRLAYQEVFNVDSGLALHFDDFDDDGNIRPLSASHCSNHIGGDLLYIGRSTVIMQMQKPTNGVFPEHWAGSSSGSFDWARDTRRATDLREVVKHGLLREFQEEAGLEDDQVPAPERCRIIGFARAVYFGGKPQFFGVAKGPDLDPRVLPTEYVSYHHMVPYERDVDGSGLLRALDRFVSSHDKVSPSLITAIEFMRMWIAEDSSAASWLFEVG